MRRSGMFWIIIGFAAIILASCSEKTGSTESIVQSLKKDGIDVYVDLLPEKVSEEREHPVTHIVLHFQVMPHLPRKIRTMWKRYGKYLSKTVYPHTFS